MLFLGICEQKCQIENLVYLFRGVANIFWIILIIDPKIFFEDIVCKYLQLPKMNGDVVKENTTTKFEPTPKI